MSEKEGCNHIWWKVHGPKLATCMLCHRVRHHFHWMGKEYGIIADSESAVLEKAQAFRDKSTQQNNQKCEG